MRDVAGLARISVAANLARRVLNPQTMGRVKPGLLVLRRHITCCSVVGFVAQKLAHFILQIAAMVRVHHAQLFLVDQHCLLLLPFLPGLTGHLLKDLLTF